MKTSRHHRELFLQLLSKDVLDELQRCTRYYYNNCFLLLCPLCERDYYIIVFSIHIIIISYQ